MLKIPLYFKSLSARLLLLTLLWVSFIVCAIGYTMILNWRLEASAAAKFSVIQVRDGMLRAVLFTDGAYGPESFNAEIDAVDRELARLKTGDPWRPLQLPHERRVTEAFEEASSLWSSEVRPMIVRARMGVDPLDDRMVSDYAARMTKLTHAIDGSRTGLLWQLRWIQCLIIVLAVGSLITIMALLLRWVIRPLDRLGEGIRRLSSGDLHARVEVGVEDEIGRIAAGFNHMADRLEDLYANLESKVAEKTASVEEKNRHLEQLYAVTSYFAQSRPLSELVEGFAERTLRDVSADATLVAFLDERKNRARLAASCGLAAECLRSIADVEAERSITASVIAADRPLVLNLSEDKRPSARALAACGMRSAWGFPVRSAMGEKGVWILLYRGEVQAEASSEQLLESFSVHLGVALDNARLIERDRQYAVVQERQLLAQGLHDSIAQALSYLNLQVQFLSDAIRTKDEKLTEESLGAIRTGVQECYEDVRELLLNFRERIHKEGFAEGVRTVVERFEAQSGVKANCTISGTGPALTERQKLQCLFIIQEALSNVRKHAQANVVDIRIENASDFRCTVVDDGLGIDEELAASRRARHVGLSIMEERAKRIGASVSVSRASPIGGTRVELFLPAQVRRTQPE